MGKLRKYARHTAWTKEEEEYLRKQSESKTDSEIAKILKRSRSSVKAKRLRMGIPSFTDQTDKINAVQIGELVGEHKTSITTTWVKKGLVLKPAGSFKVTSEDQLVKFMKEHPDLWKASRCDRYFFGRYQFFTDRLEREKAGTETYNRYKNYRHWTDWEISRVKMLKRRGLSDKEIAKELGRTSQAIYHLNRRLMIKESK